MFPTKIYENKTTDEGDVDLTCNKFVSNQVKSNEQDETLKSSETADTIDTKFSLFKNYSNSR